MEHPALAGPVLQAPAHELAGAAKRARSAVGSRDVNGVAYLRDRDGCRAHVVAGNAQLGVAIPAPARHPTIGVQRARMLQAQGELGDRRSRQRLRRRDSHRGQRRHRAVRIHGGVRNVRFAAGERGKGGKGSKNAHVWPQTHGPAQRSTQQPSTVRGDGGA